LRPVVTRRVLAIGSGSRSFIPQIEAFDAPVVLPDRVDDDGNRI